MTTEQAGQLQEIFDRVNVTNVLEMGAISQTFNDSGTGNYSSVHFFITMGGGTVMTANNVLTSNNKATQTGYGQLKSYYSSGQFRYFIPNKPVNIWYHDGTSWIYKENCTEQITIKDRNSNGLGVYVIVQ